MEEVGAAVFEEVLDNLNGFLYLSALDAGVEQNIEEQLSCLRTNDRALNDHPWVIRIRQGLARATALEIVLLEAAFPVEIVLVR